MAVGDMFDSVRNTVLFNFQFGGGEMDVCCITKAGYVREVEVKCSLADWNADQHKDKWRKGGWLEEQRAKVNEFYYAVPTALIDRLPEWVPPEAGLIEVYWYQGSYARFAAVIRRPAKRCSKHTLTANEWRGICRHLYYRHCTARRSRYLNLLQQHCEKAVPA
jgi:hypothetical protein